MALVRVLYACCSATKWRLRYKFISLVRVRAAQCVSHDRSYACVQRNLRATIARTRACADGGSKNSLVRVRVEIGGKIFRSYSCVRWCRHRWHARTRACATASTGKALVRVRASGGLHSQFCAPNYGPSWFSARFRALSLPSWEPCPHRSHACERRGENL